MASVTVGENQLQRIIRDLHDAVAELTKEHAESGEPITDDSPSLHKFSYKLEYLLQFDQKEKATFLGSRKDYWDYFCDCLAKNKGTNDGIRFVKSISELKTSLGKGRAFIRYCLVHQRLADTLQQCLMNQRVTCDWYYARSPFLKSHLNVDIINHLYELNEIQFDVASRGYDLDSEWPAFARRTIGSAVPGAHLWRPPSRCSSVNSLVSNYSQQVQEFLPGSTDLGTSFQADLGELGELSSSAVDDLRVELDQSELRKQQLQEQVHLLTDEATELKQEVADLQVKLLAAESANKKPYKEEAGKAEVEKLEARCKTEDWAKQAERLSKELKAQGEKLKESEEALAKLRTSSEKERTIAVQQADELQVTVSHLNEALSLKEQEAKNLHTQVQDMQSLLQERVQQLEEVKKKAQLEREELQQKSSSLKEALDSQIVSLQEQLKAKEIKLSISNQKIQQLENKENQSKKLEEYKTQCVSLMEINAKLVSTVKRSEESNKELAQTKAALERELTSLKVSEKQTKARLGSTGLTVEEREKLFVEESQCLEENTQKSQMKTGANMKERHGQLDNGLSSRENKTVSDQELKDVQNEEVTDHRKDLHLTQHSQTGEAASRLALAEAQLDLNMKEVSRLQEEVVDLRARLQMTSEERMKIQALQEVTEASRADLSAQTEQLKAQVEGLNHQHIEELLHCREREEALEKKWDTEAQARASLQTELDSMKEELDMMKRQNNALALENEEAKEALHRANTETAELGVQVCMLTGQHEEARLRCEELSAKLQELLVVQNDTQTLKDSVETLRKENVHLQKELKQAEGLAKDMKQQQQRLEGAQEEARSLRKSNQRELSALQLQLSEATTYHQNQMKVLNEELLGTRSQMEAEQEKVSSLETRLAELEANNTSLSETLEEKNACIAKFDTLLHQKEEQLNQIQSDLAKAQEELALTQKACQDLSENLRRALMEKETCDLKSSAEIDDLYRTKRNLEERLIELIREKDALWQKSDALEFEQKLRAEEQSDRELPYCSECHTQFSWWLRRHNCKLCGRPFCYYCCSHAVSSQQGGVRERCCKDCYTRHGAAERHPQEELGSPSRVSYSPLCSTPTRASMPSVTVAPQSPRPDDAAFDIITDEEVNCIYDSDTLPYTTALSPGSGQQGTHEISSSTSGGDLTADESEELPSSVQNAEICLLKSGEVTLSVPFSVEEISNFGQESRELFIKSSCYSLIPITVVTAGPTISWVFSSTPKSISFSVVYRESTDIPLEQAKVLIPLTRCNSHKDAIRGQVKARNPGEYALIFDNSFSRFISKKVLYKLSVEQTVVYDGSD
ncbi:FYVE and coiled-coil domain-containing protein 1 isoform X1 [Pangasianodon hypophthalmus]|uniref:FYVE and coiled-coil domain-containing protein 1 isoform X1 n=1 Tax=Pangasianodon hypophthalmus TaxID=310915 RepID=UPI00230700CA|nr:FYVE and coiled-coil domain-containing protein 1 isoform X1 [Pangasianodon hypophthalmus]XP_026801936.3 FYVE and coiled-coil domain-containing protein 1 isoform X1 [Pangasianodon hypophthalmus]XP_034170567.2 FYVE and coiled-coil domain-containing protein 1 isoform X1 [Pangasianodon hypophthalmus]